jgi:pimeloyl-[acyl-carrier protein] synthase
LEVTVIEPVGALDPVSAFLVDAFSPEHRRDPYRLYRRMLEGGPVVDASMNMCLVFTHSACWSTVRAPAASSDERRGTLHQRESLIYERLAAQRSQQPWLVFLDPPVHTRLRSLVATAFTPRRIERLRQRIVELTDELLDAMSEGADDGDGVVDVIEAIAYPLPIIVICELLGVPARDQLAFRRWSAALTKSIDPGVLRTDADNLAIDDAKREMHDYVAELLEERRASPSDDLLSALLDARDGDDRLELDEIIDLATLLLLAGHETTVSLIGNGLDALLRNRDQLDAWRNDPTLDDVAIDELLRFDSPLQMVQRIATEPLTIDGVDVPVGDQIIVMLAAANRDPAMFDDPDRVDLRRANANRHLSFGGGIHHCLGASLARTEGSIVLGRLIRRFPGLQAAGEPTLRDTFNLRGREHLPIALSS